MFSFIKRALGCPVSREEKVEKELHCSPEGFCFSGRGARSALIWALVNLEGFCSRAVGFFYSECPVPPLGAVLSTMGKMTPEIPPSADGPLRLGATAGDPRFPCLEWGATLAGLEPDIFGSEEQLRYPLGNRANAGAPFAGVIIPTDN